MKKKSLLKKSFILSTITLFLLLPSAAVLALGPEPPPPPPSGSPRLETGRNVYLEGERIVVYFANLPGGQKNWISIYPAGADNHDYGEWFYTDGESNGIMYFQGLDVGSYEARLFYNDSYSLEQKAAFTVEPMATGAPVFAPDGNLYEGMNAGCSIQRPEGKRIFDVYIPPEIVERPALIVDIHSLYANKETQKGSSGMRALAQATKGFIVAWPQGFNDSFNGGTCCGYAKDNGINDVAFITEMIDYIKDNVRIDARKIYAMGFSNGGAMSHYLGYRAPAHIAAISANSFAFDQWLKNNALNHKGDSGYHPVPFLGIHGYNDQVNCWNDVCATTIIGSQSNGGYRGWHRWAEVNECTGEYTVLADNSDSTRSQDHLDYKWIRAYQDCAGGVEVRQILNSQGHGFEGPLMGGKDGVASQSDYARRIWEFFSRWTIPVTTEVYEPSWWNE